MVKEGFLEHQKGRTMEKAKSNLIDFPSLLEFYK